MEILRIEDETVNWKTENTVLDHVESSSEMLQWFFLIVGMYSAGESHVTRCLANHCNIPPNSGNLRLFNELRELSHRRCPSITSGILSQIISDSKRETIVVNNTKVLFGSELMQVTIKLLQLVSKYRTLISTWTGAIGGNRLAYAFLSQSEFRKYKLTDTTNFCMSNGKTID